MTAHAIATGATIIFFITLMYARNYLKVLSPRTGIIILERLACCVVANTYYIYTLVFRVAAITQTPKNMHQKKEKGVCV